LASLNPETSKSECHVQNSTAAPAYSKPATSKTAVPKPVAQPSLPVEIIVSQVRVKDYSVKLTGDKEEKEREDFIPMASNKPSGLDLEEFLPVSNSDYNIYT
jgi:hypothetical protein